MLQVHAVSAFTDNYIWLIQAANSRQVLIVDPGDATPVVQAIQQQQWLPAGILITHHHADHTGGIASLCQQFELPVFGPAGEAINGLTQRLQACRQQQLHPAFPDFDILPTPGHTPGHISYLLDNKLFCGDTLFAAGCGRLLGGTAEQLHRSLQQLAELPDNTEVFCAHEYTLSNLQFALAVEPSNPAIQQRYAKTRQLRRQQRSTVPSLLAEERQSNPFLRCNEPAVIAATERQCGRQLSSSLEVFRQLRLWKDRFQAA